MGKILITGGTGLIGKALRRALLIQGKEVVILSRNPVADDEYYWNPARGAMDVKAIEGVDCIIHLAGAGIAEKRWTNKRKKEIIDSRVQSADLLFKVLSEQKHEVKHFISSSAIGYYSERGDELMDENSMPHHDFLASSCIAWEHGADKFTKLNLKVAKIRTGIVLSKDGGALATMMKPFQFFAGSVLGNGKQWMSWIHLQDVVGLYLHVYQQQLEGIYNAVAPNPVNNKEFSHALAKQMSRPIWLPAVPGFALKFVLGEMAAVVLGSTKVSSRKIQDSGFKFQFPTLTVALRDLI